MNCCDSAGKCTNGPGCATRTPRGEWPAHNCDELGVCQERHQRCGGCLVRHDTAGMRASFATGPQLRGDLAPGMVEGYRVPFFGTRSQRRELVRIAKASAWWLTWSAVAGLAVGLIAGALS